MDVASKVGPAAVKAVADKWKLLPAFLKAKGLVKQHIDSFDFFVKTEIKQIVRANSNRLIRSEADPAFFIEFLDVRVGEPRMEETMVGVKLTPLLCRNRDLTYAAPIFVDVEFLRGREIVRRRNVEIGRIPVMLRSCVCVLRGKSSDEMQKLGECPHDPGGYFVVKGTEKVILMQEQLSKNRIIVELDFKRCVAAVVTSATAESKSRTSAFFKGGKVYLRHNSFLEDIPVCIVLKAMGMETDQEIAQMVGTGAHHLETLSHCIQDCILEEVTTQDRALTYIGHKMRYKSKAAQAVSMHKGACEKPLVDDAVETLQRVVLSHIESQGGNFVAKRRFLCLMIRRVIDAEFDRTQLDDRDYYGNKRLELAGQLVSLMFEDLFKRFTGQVKKQADQAIGRYVQSKNSASTKSKDSLQYPDCFRNVPTDIITRGMQSAMSTGNWNIKRFRMERSGVTQVLSRFSFIASLGMMTRINSQFEKGRKVSGPRALQPSQWGMLCPCDTPEGESCGLVKNLSLMTHVTTDLEVKPILRLAFALGMEPAETLTGEELNDPGTFLVFVNGILMGVHRRPKEFMRCIRHMRRHGYVGEFVSVFDNDSHRAIYIAADGGRLCRPLIIVEKGRPKIKEKHMKMLREGEMNFFDFLKSGVLEWIDVNEENNLLIALRDWEVTTQTTHLEIDPLSIMGVVAGLIPYPHHNQSPRNTYQCAMGKQAMGAIAFNQFARCDTVLYLLCYPQKPLCKTRTIEFIGFEQLPAGQNASVAVMSYSGYDIEDAIIMNRGALDRGYGRCYVIKRTSVELKRYFNGACDRVFPPPAPVARTGNRHGSGMPVQHRRFQILDDDGVARVGELVAEEQIFVHKFSPINTKDHVGDPSAMDASQYRPSPAKYKPPVPAYIDRVICAENAENSRVYKVLLRQTRRPEYGDKFSSRHGQKGVVGLIVPHEDMPFSDTGWTPDMVMNPHGFPSRMTVGKMIELIAGKSALLDGNFKYGTAFGGTKVADIGEILLSKGFHYSGKEFLTSGVTGEPLETYIFVGPIYYQKLKHMVQDKMHARGRGPRQLLTRQPTEGRSKQGGLRLGEMERDCLVAYGTSNLLLERLMLSSDAFEASVCGTCGLIGFDGYCPRCKSSEGVALVRMPYACKLLFQELLAMNVCPRISLAPCA